MLRRFLHRIWTLSQRERFSIGSRRKIQGELSLLTARMSSSCRINRWQSHGKPNPEPYLRGAEALQVAAAESVVLEDAPSGVQSAYRAGMRVIGILSSCTREQLSEASVCIGSLRELPKGLAALGIR